MSDEIIHRDDLVLLERTGRGRELGDDDAGSAVPSPVHARQRRRIVSSLEQDVVTLCRAARAAAPALARASTAEKNAALRAGAKALRARTDDLIAANAGDVAAARAAGGAAAFLDRLTLTPARVDAMAVGLEQIADLPDPGRRGDQRAGAGRTGSTSSRCACRSA